MEPKIAPRPPAALLHVSFDSRQVVKIDLVQDLLARILGRTGCPACGLGGLDVILRKTDIVGPVDKAFTATLEGISG